MQQMANVGGTSVSVVDVWSAGARAAGARAAGAPARGLGYTVDRCISVGGLLILAVSAVRYLYMPPRAV